MPDTHSSGTRVTKLLQQAESDPNALLELERFRKTLVVMFSDIQGSTAYFEKYGDAAGLFMVHQCNDNIRRMVEKHGGTVIKTIGDGTMATFPEPQSAIQSAVETQAALVKFCAAHKESERIALRIGMHYGTGIVRTKDVFGDVVNTASRVESVAGPGQIVISEEVYQSVRGGAFTIRELGRFTLKGKTGERTLFAVIWDSVQGVPKDTCVDSANVEAPCAFMLQLVTKNGSSGAEYPVQGELGIGLSQQGKLMVSPDVQLPLRRARVFVEDRALFIDADRSAGEGVFLRLAGAYVLEQEDIFLAGQQVFRYEEKPETAPSLTAIATGAAGIEASAANAAELIRTDGSGNITGRYPLNPPEVQFGRSRGTYVFPDDNLMSRGHLRIAQRGEDFVLEDVGSRNGTFVKLRRKTPLPPGSALLIAGQLLKVAIAGISGHGGSGKDA